MRPMYCHHFWPHMPYVYYYYYYICAPKHMMHMLTPLFIFTLLAGKACWQAHGSTLVSAAQLMQLTCACVLYLMLVADFFNDVFERHSLSLAVWLVLAGVLVLPSVFLNTMNRISWMSMFSVFSLVLVFCSVIGYGLTQRHTWDFGMPLTTFEGDSFRVAGTSSWLIAPTRQQN